MPLRHRLVDSPLGLLSLAVDDADALAALCFSPDHHPPPRPGALGDPAPPGPDPGLERAAEAVLAYLSGATEVVEVPLAPRSGTALQLAVWGQLEAVPRGGTTTYGALAAAVGRPTAVRAVGQAVARNPTCLVVPCHRVLASGDRVVGYAGGPDRKRWLLALESGGPLPPLAPGPIVG